MPPLNEMPHCCNTKMDSSSSLTIMMASTVLLETSYVEDFGSSQTDTWIPFFAEVLSTNDDSRLSDQEEPPPPLEDCDSSLSSKDSSTSTSSPPRQQAGAQLANIEVYRSHDDDEDVVSFGTAREKRVLFSTVETREYMVIVGDHPGCSNGLPLSLDWKFNPCTTLVSVYDIPLPTTTRPARRLSLLQRIHILKMFSTSDQIWLAEGRRRDREKKEEDALLKSDRLVAEIFDELRADTISSCTEKQLSPNCDISQCIVAELA